MKHKLKWLVIGMICVLMITMYISPMYTSAQERGRNCVGERKNYHYDCEPLNNDQHRIWRIYDVECKYCHSTMDPVKVFDRDESHSWNGITDLGHRGHYHYFKLHCADCGMQGQELSSLCDAEALGEHIWPF